MLFGAEPCSAVTKDQTKLAEIHHEINGSITLQSASLGDSFILINKRMTNYTPGTGSMHNLIHSVFETN